MTHYQMPTINNKIITRNVIKKETISIFYRITI